MMLARAITAAPWGIEARPVQVEVDIHPGLPQIQIVGLPDAAVRESRERMRTAIKNCGFDLPPRAVTVNLAPADLRKEGNHLDLAIALALLAAHGHLPTEALAERLICGELGLDGAIRSVRGGLAIAALGARLRAREVLLPAANAPEAAALGAVPVIALRGLAEAIEHLLGVHTLPSAVYDSGAAVAASPEQSADLAEVRGQEGAKRALEVAAAGGHNLLFIGPPGTGKTMLARRLPGLLPALTAGESIAVTKIQSLVAEEPPAGLVTHRPFRAPHPGTSTAGMVGGGPIPRPGEVSLAHAGVLFLDELPEFRRDTLEALRQPLEEGRVSVVRARARYSFPARFALLAAMNPCPCGHLGDRRHECRCPPQLVERYRARISGPLLDRIDLHVEMPALALRDLRGADGESTATVAARVERAREIQARRFGAAATAPRTTTTPTTPATVPTLATLATGATAVNAAMSASEVRRHCALDGAAQSLLDAAFERLGLSTRALDRVVKVARTIADLASCERLSPAHIAEAIQYRSLDRRLVE